MFTVNSPRLPLPGLEPIVTTANPFPEMFAGKTETVTLFELPTSAAVTVCVPVAPDKEKLTVFVCSVLLLWLKVINVESTTPMHCGMTGLGLGLARGVGVGSADGLGAGVGVGLECGLPLPFPFPFPFPGGVGVVLGFGSGGGGAGVGVLVGKGVGSG